MASGAGAIDRFFHLSARRTTVGRELRGAVATFLTMAYILFVNPDILTQAKGATPEMFGAFLVSTALAAGVCCILMGAVANFPIALASGMGLNAIVAYQVSTAAGSWQAAMGLIVLDGLLTTLLVLTGLREAVMHAIPRDLRLAIGAGIGLFIAFIGLVNAKLVIAGAAGAPPVAAGHLADPATRTALIGLLATAFLVARRVNGALILGILLTTGVAFLFGATRWPATFPLPSFTGVAFQADVRAALRWDLMPLLFAVVMVDFFDTIGTASAVAESAGLVDERGRVPGVRRILAVDSLSAAIGGALGASSVTSYIESAAGVAEGARTGLHTVFVGLLFLLAIFLAPVAGVVPAAATAPALILVGFLMIAQIVKVNFDDYETAIPAFLTLLTIPLTYSIAHGIGYGFIAYVVIKLLARKPREPHPLMYLASAAFLAYFIWS
ncbi:MAG TPA: NCS2 family permease [Tepidisphaeraceae bacterium]|nr:NCS2 family permease [Tepidisphaeraceae bacterium]